MKTYPLPNARQEAWADLEMGVIIHHGMEIYHPDEAVYSEQTMPAHTFAPTDENPEQWLEAAAAMGARYAVFVANHSTGFSMWPTKVNDYSMVQSPFRDGKADVVRDFIRACEKYNIRPGLYYSIHQNGYYGVNAGKDRDFFSEKYQDYFRKAQAQLTELWSEYGELFEIWFDGGIVPVEKGGPDIASLLRKYQPNAVCFQGPADHTQNLRWVGNERGVAPVDCWATAMDNTCSFDGQTEFEKIGMGNPEGSFWIPAETDMGNRKQQAFGGGWCWRAGEENLVYPPEELFQRYLTSVGRNSNLLMGMCISPRGHFEDTEQLKKFGDMVRDLYHDPAGEVRGTGRELELRLDRAENLRYLVIREDIHYGERIRSFTVEIQRDTRWEPLFSAGCIGHKRILTLSGPIRAIRLRVLEAVDTPIIRSMTCYR